MENLAATSTSESDLSVKDASAIAPKAGDWRPADTNLIRAIAAILISNSHLESYYPRSWMAGDGLIGNSMFFFLSGFGVALASRSRSLGFFPWMLRRISRIYPAVIFSIIVIQLIFLQGWRLLGAWAYPRIFLYPTTYAFVGQVMIVYVILYFVLKPKSGWPHFIALVIMIAASLVYYVQLVPILPAHSPLTLGNPITGNMQWYYFTALGLFGGLLSPRTRRPRQTTALDLTLLSGVFALYLVVKLAMVRGHFPRWFILLHLMTVVICVLTVRVSASDAVQSLLRQIKPLNLLITLLAAITLEMYIMQFWTTAHFGIQNLPYPQNLIVFWITTIASAWLLAKIVSLGKQYLPRSRPAP